MTKVLSCLDGSVYADSVTDHAAWAALKLKAPVELLHVLGRRDVSTAAPDLSGSIAADAQQHLLAELAALDADRARLAQKRGRLLLDAARERLGKAGVADVTLSLRHGDLLEAIAEREADAALIVIGKRGEAADFASLHLGSNLERVVRSAHRPVLVASRAFRPIRRILIAFDGGASALEGVVLDELAARLHHVAHQLDEDVVGRRRPSLILTCSSERAFAVERRLPELLGVHLAEALVALQLQALAAGAIDGVSNSESGPSTWVSSPLRRASPACA
jgi:nucleotide-binding universal stress UspA family protein